MNSPETTPTNLEINPKFAARVCAHQPTWEEVKDAIRFDLREAGGFVIEGSYIPKITHGYEAKFFLHNTEEKTIIDLVSRRQELLVKQHEAETNKFIDRDKLEEALALCEEELNGAIQAAIDTAKELPSQLAVEHYFNPGTDRMEWDQSKKVG